jgi:hypothetical protein
VSTTDEPTISLVDPLVSLQDISQSNPITTATISLDLTSPLPTSVTNNVLAQQAEAVTKIKQTAVNRSRAIRKTMSHEV